MTARPPTPVSPTTSCNSNTALLSQVAASDPKRALQLATESLSKGYSFELLNLVQRLNEKDAEAATKFAGEVARRLRAENLLRNREALHVAAQFLQATAQRRQTMATLGGAGGGWAGGKPLALDEQTRRDLVDALVTAALAADPADGYHRHYYLFSTLRSTMAEVEKQAADRAPLVRRRMAEFEQTLGSANRKWADYEQLLRQDSPDALLEAAAKVPSEMRQAFYSGAAWAALGAGDAERARKIVTDNFSGGQRTQMLEMLDHHSLLDSLKQGKVEEARQFVARIRDDQKRAGALAKLALWAASKGDKKTARLLLAEAREIVGERPRNLEQLEAHLQLARAYALVEPPRAFEIVETAVDRANDMIAAADVLDGFLGGPEIFRDGELLMHRGRRFVGDHLRAVRQATGGAGARGLRPREGRRLALQPRRGARDGAAARRTRLALRPPAARADARSADERGHHAAAEILSARAAGR